MFSWPWKREIYRSDGELYLTRYYLFRKPVKWMPSIYIHCIHKSDEDMELHSHPWNGLSIIFSGSYIEERRNKERQVERFLFRPGNVNIIRKNDFHRIDLIDREVWTLFLSGNKVQDWGFWNRDTNEYTPWKIHVRRKNVRAT